MATFHFTLSKQNADGFYHDFVLVYALLWLCKSCKFVLGNKEQSKMATKSVTDNSNTGAKCASEFEFDKDGSD